MFSERDVPRRKCLPLAEVMPYFSSLGKGWPQKHIGVMTYNDPSMRTLVDYDFWVDIDSEDKKHHDVLQNIEQTLPNCVKLLGLLHKAHLIAPKDVGIYFSGHGGFHLLLPFSLCTALDPLELKYLVKKAVNEFRTCLGSWWPGSHIDMSTYDNKKMIRLPWSLHKSGLRKVELNLDDLALPASDMLRLITERSATFTSEPDLRWLRDKKSNEEFVAYVCRPSRLILPASSLPGTPTSPLDDFINDVAKAAPCVAELVTFRLPIKPHVKFNQQKIYLLSHLRRWGPFQYALEIGKAFADKYSERAHSTADQYRARRDEVHRAAETIFHNSANSTYDFRIRGQCVRKLETMVTGAFDTICEPRKCAHRCRSAWQEPTRIGIANIFKRCGNPTNLYIYFSLVIDGAAYSLTDLAMRLSMSRNTVRAAISDLKARGLVSVTKVGKGQEIKAIKSAVKSLLIKN